MKVPNAFTAAVIINIVLATLVALGLDGGYSAPLWLLSVFLILRKPFPESLKLPVGSLFSLKTAFVLIVIALPALVRFLCLDYAFVHRDEFLVSWLSSEYDLLRTPFFQPVPTPNDWVAQFPSLYFFTQKIIFLLIGESPLTVKVSILPYVLLAAYSLFLIAKRFVGPAGASIAVIMYGFFAPAMYFEIFGLHIIASMAVFSFFCATLFEEERSESLDYWSGVAFAVCFLHYTSSYLALPVFGAYAASMFFRRGKESFASIFRIGWVACLVLLPFASYWIFESFYVAQRTQQVNLLSGSWSHDAEAITQGASILGTVWESFVRCLKSFAFDGYGGNGDYNFGHISLLDPFTLFLLVAGLSSLAVKAYRDKRAFMLLSIVVLGFFFGAVLTTSKPVAFHRLSIIFALLPLVCFIPVWALASGRRFLIVDLFLLCWVTTNVLHYLEFKKRDREIGIEMTDDVIVVDYLREKFPGVPVKVAAYPGLAYERISRFFDNSRDVQTEYHRTFLDALDPEKPYLYVVLDLDGFPAIFQEKDPKGRLIEAGSRRLKIFTNIPSASE